MAHLAEARRCPLAIGGGWPDHNTHLMAPVSDHHGVVVHAWQWTLAETLYAHPPRAAGGVLTLTEAAGLGLESREAVLRETALSRR